MPENQQAPNNRPAAPPPKAQGAPAAASKKKKAKPNPAVLACILLVVLIGACFAAVYFDLAGMKQTAVTLLKLDTPTQGQTDAKKAAEDALALEKQEMNKVSTEQKKTANDQKKTAVELDKREKELAQKETAVEDRQKELDALQQQLNGKQIDYAALVAMFENMAPAKAAAAISAMKKVGDMVRLLAGMKSEKAALILENMDQKIATKILAAGLSTAVTVPAGPSPSAPPTGSAQP